MVNWFLSKTVRQATAMRKHVEKLLHHQEDILSPQAKDALVAAIADVRKAIAGKVDKEAMEKQMQALEGVANKWLKPYPNHIWRENIEVLLVALAVAMAIRTFFLQPFKIPTGSMQPTLYGVTSDPDFSAPGFRSQPPDREVAVSAMNKVVIPTGWEKIRQWFAGNSYVHVVAKSDGEVTIEQPCLVKLPFKTIRFPIFSIYQLVHIGDQTQIIWFPPDYGTVPLEMRAGLAPHQPVHRGEDIVKMRVQAGDHLFVDRVSYNFRPPRRGEIIVFETRGIQRLEPDQRDTFYIKRLVGLGGETLSLHQDYVTTNVPGFPPELALPIGHLVVDGKPLSASTPGFENLYSFNGASSTAKVVPYKSNHYYGHSLLWDLSPGGSVRVDPDNLFVMGDNTMNSSDGRRWGDFPRDRVIGRSFFVYWPITTRFGVGYH